jgi:hypothetical protein
MAVIDRKRAKLYAEAIKAAEARLIAERGAPTNVAAFRVCARLLARIEHAPGDNPIALSQALQNSVNLLPKPVAPVAAAGEEDPRLRLLTDFQLELLDGIMARLEGQRFPPLDWSVASGAAPEGETYEDGTQRTDALWWAEFKLANYKLASPGTVHYRHNDACQNAACPICHPGELEREVERLRAGAVPPPAPSEAAGGVLLVPESPAATDVSERATEEKVVRLVPNPHYSGGILGGTGR